jgi:hypothetical protein
MSTPTRRGVIRRFFEPQRMEGNIGRDVQPSDEGAIAMRAENFLVSYGKGRAAQAAR